MWTHDTIQAELEYRRQALRRELRPKHSRGLWSVLRSAVRGRRGAQAAPQQSGSVRPVADPATGDAPAGRPACVPPPHRRTSAKAHGGPRVGV